jgi:type II secretory pathway component PulF
MSQTALLRLSFVPAIAVGALAFLCVPYFIALYASFALQLPPQTTFLFTWYRPLTLVPLLSIAVAWFAWPQSDKRGAVTLASAFLSRWHFVRLDTGLHTRR